MRRALWGSTLALALSACGGGSEPEKEHKLVAETLLELDLGRPPEERSAAALLGEGRPSHFEALMRVQKLAKDPLARGLFVRIGAFGGRFSDVDDWAQAFESYRAEKKPVHCHFDEVDNAGYALAAHCDRLSMTPSGLLNLVGLALQVVHGRELLELLGLRAELFQVGKYKGAAEPFTRDALSPEQRESLDTLLADLDENFRAHLGKRIQGNAAGLTSVIDGGPYTSDGARAAGLVDAISYDDEARSHGKRAAGARLVHRLFEPSDHPQVSLPELVSALTGRRKRTFAGQAHLGVAFLTGDIRDGGERTLDGAASDPFVRALRRWGDEPDVRAVVLRIESPGGSALASDRMWHAVQRVARRKPVIVSLGDMAASGGYYVASAGSAIVAGPGSIVGSIGVVGGKIVVDGLAKRAGVHVSTLSHGAHATWLSPFQGFSPPERQVFEDMLQNTYGRFLERVARGRKREVESLLPAAEGRVMGGARARELGLVDEVGGLARAVALARERGKLPESAPIETWPDANDPLAALSSLMQARSAGADAPASTAAGWADALLPEELASAGSLLRTLAGTRSEALTALPFALYVR